MSQLDERIAQFRKMATDDPDNELGHYRLGQLLMDVFVIVPLLPLAVVNVDAAYASFD